MQIVSKKVNHVFEADIRSYFTRISHQWLRKAFSLSVHPDKTRLIEFGRHAAADRKKRAAKQMKADFRETSPALTEAGI